MDGRTLKRKLLEIKDAQTTLNDIAEKMGIAPQNLQTWFAAADVKSGTIERLANILGVPPTAFYGDTITATDASIAINGDGNNAQTFDGHLINIIEQQSQQLTTAQAQISNLIEIISKKNG